MSLQETRCDSDDGFDQIRDAPLELLQALDQATESDEALRTNPLI